MNKVLLQQIVTQLQADGHYYLANSLLVDVEHLITLPLYLADKTIDSILSGIDIDECSGEAGWWETSEGAAFGAKKLAEIKAFFATSQAAQKHVWLVSNKMVNMFFKSENSAKNAVASMSSGSIFMEIQRIPLLDALNPVEAL